MLRITLTKITSRTLLCERRCRACLAFHSRCSASLSCTVRCTRPPRFTLAMRRCRSSCAAASPARVTGGCERSCCGSVTGDV
jgi:hypothetical protein